MTTVTATAATPAASRGLLGGLAGGISDTFALTARNLIMYRRLPQLLVFSTIQPVVFVLMFRYVFGGAINVPGGDYIDFLMPGVFAQTVVFGAMATAIGLATDLQTGFVERFKALPMAHSSVLAARIFADLARNVFVIALMTGVGFAVGFRVHTSALGLIASLLLLLGFGYAMSWIFATVGILVRDPETAQAAGFPVLAPLVFASSAFVPVSSMPGWLQPWANNQPVSVVVTASRALVLGGPTASHVWVSIAWIVGIVVLFAPVAIWRYHHSD